MRITEFKDPFTGRTGVYMFTLDHLERHLIFRNKADFTYGVNTLAFGTLKHGVRVLCYVLMDNHIHLLLAGTYPECLAYYQWVLHRLSLMLGHRYGVSGLLSWKSSDVQAVKDEQMLLNEVCYLLRNGYKARIDSPFSYPWTPPLADWQGRKTDTWNAGVLSSRLGASRWSDPQQVFRGLPYGGRPYRQQPCLF